MWLFTTSGFFSAVARDGEICVRARRKCHLEALKKKHGLKGRIQANKGTDYRYRLNVGVNTWSWICQDEALDIDYGNFKGAAAQVAGSGEYVALLHKIWNACWDFQRGEGAAGKTG